ncbi:pirin family protein [Bacillus thermotolerans]|uniref:Pirin-like protein n=1 Tax=Bacillus thermotolerans TaxID=1221996 RepID=A0A0F5HM58_BACTR|nr:pirin-like C-terminal cupin domain-containing protein [Bacillus thermotolerans]KKB34353.1 pirin-like protein [Bacillus thermotolerans]KKB41101.1 pirin-like protein [Bacillus thermotolerans]
MEETNKAPFQRDINKHWKVSYNQPGYPHVQQGWVLPPERMKAFDPFILMAEDWFKRGTFSDHPHRGFQTITYVIDGRLEHVDNSGGYSILDAGDVQYMNAGRGARHAEEAFGEDLIHTLQLWLNLPKSLKNSESFYQNIYVDDASVVEVDGGSVRVYAGDVAGVQGPMESLVPVTMAEVTLKEGAAYTHILPENHNAFLYMLAGEMAFGSSQTALSKTEAATLTFNEHGDEAAESAFVMKANSRAKVLIYSGVPIREEIAARGPFVMNTMEEVRQAYADFQHGLFGPPAVKND